MFFLHQLLHSLLVLVIFFLAGCDSTISAPETAPEAKPIDLELIESFPLDISDPSGLTIDISGEFLWTVSDDPGGVIYKISFEGELIGAITSYEGDDMEGITMNPNDGSLWIAEEKLRKLVQLTPEGEVLQLADVPVESVNPNDGLEGIAWLPEKNHVFVLNEKNPRKFIELDSNIDVVRSVSINFDAPFDMTDLSGLFYEQAIGELWIVSDESKKIVVADIDLNPLRVYNLPYDKFEGIAVDIANKRLYLVNDRENSLYVFQIPD